MPWSVDLLRTCVEFCVQTAGVLAAISQSNFPSAIKDQLTSAGQPVSAALHTSNLWLSSEKMTPAYFIGAVLSGHCASH